MTFVALLEKLSNAGIDALRAMMQWFCEQNGHEPLDDQGCCSHCGKQLVAKPCTRCGEMHAMVGSACARGPLGLD